MDINLKFDENGLIPAVVQDINTGKVLMLAYMNEESLKRTLETKKTWFYSRSRKELWNKGATSGNFQEVKRISFDCDADSLLVEVLPAGPACHTGEESCFFYPIVDEGYPEGDILKRLYSKIVDRKNNPVDNSYTNYLFDKGIDKILKKVGEEASEVIIGAKNHDKEELVYEISDLVYHVLVLMAEEKVTPEDIKNQLKSRYK